MKLTIVEYNKMAGIGAHIIYAINRLARKKRNEILYFKFNNFFYRNFKEKNTWEDFFYQPFEKYKKIISNKISNKDYNLEYNLNHKNLLIYNDLKNIKKTKNKISKLRKIFKKYIKFKPILIKECNKYKKNKSIMACVGVHLRGTDKFNKFDKNINKLNSNKYKSKEKIFLATDSLKSLNYMMKIYGDKIITQNTRLNEDNEAMHVVSLFESESNKKKLCKEALFDAIILSKCKFNYYSESNLSLLSLLMRNDFNYKFLNNGKSLV